MAGVELGRYRRLVQYFWDPEPVNDKSTQTSIWCLGKEYKTLAGPSTLRNSSDIHPKIQNVISISHNRPETPPNSISNIINEEPAYYSSRNECTNWPLAFLDDFEARVSFTYRSGFPAIPRSQDLKTTPSLSLSVRLRSQLIEGAAFTSDTGWGCMIRSGQSLLANALIFLRLGRDWRRSSSVLMERKIISLFADDPKAPFSIHKFVEHGASSCGKHPGEWFGPSATARCIEALTDRYESSDLSVYLTGDSLEVYEDNFLATAKADGVNFKPTLILVGTRLGLEQITPVYWQALKASLQMPQSVGIAGGHPSSSHYFVGVQGSYFFYLDPHQTQPALSFLDDVGNYTQEEIDSCHTRRLRRIHIKEMDPSMLIAFLIRDENDWTEWRRTIDKVEGKNIVRVANVDPFIYGLETGRNSAIDEVETLDDDDENT